MKERGGMHMKKLCIAVLLFCTLSGCAIGENTTATPETSATTQSTTPTQSTQGTTAATAPTETPITFQLFLPDEHWDGFVESEMTIDTLQPELLIQALAERDVLSKDVTVNSAEVEGTQLRLDLNEAFFTQLCSMGSSGERILMGCLVNTFISAYQCETVFVTVEGQIIHSGHVDYDFPMGPFV